MSILSLLVIGILISIFETSSAPTEISDEDIMKYDIMKYFGTSIDPVRYTVNLEINFKSNSYAGKCITEFRLLNETFIIRMHAKGLNIYNPIVTNEEMSYRPRLQQGQNIITIYFDTLLKPGHYKLILSYWSFLTQSNGLFKTLYKSKEGLEEFVISRIQNVEIHRMFPCWNHPGYSSAIINMSIFHHRNYTALANMLTRDSRKELPTYHEFVWTHFEGIYLAPYQVAIVVSTFLKDTFRGRNIRSRREAKPHLKLGNALLKTLSPHFQSEWGKLKPYIFREVNHVAVTAYPENSLITRGLVLYRETDIMYNKEVHTFVHAIYAVRLIARGMAYQYISGIVNLADWRYMWLHDGLTTLLATEAIQKETTIPAMDFFVVETLHESFRWDHFFMEPLVYNPINVSTFNPLKLPSYHLKAPFILRMLQHILTDKIFRERVKSYLNNNKPTSKLSIKDFWRNIGSGYRSKEPNDTYTIKKRMNNWVKMQHYPILHVVRINSRNVRITVQNVRMLTGNWSIPLTLTTEKELNFTWPKNFIWFRTEPNITFINYDFHEESGWVIVNLQQVGYYRVNYDNENWNKIGKYLREQNYSNIHVLNRAQIIDDAFYFLKTRHIDLKIFLALAQYLWRTTNFIAWYPMLKAFEYVASFLPYSESGQFKSEIKLILEKIPFAYIRTLTNQTGEPTLKSFRLEITRWVCIFNTSQSAQLSSNEIVEDLKQERTYVPTDKEWIYNTASRNVDRVTWKNMFSLYLNKSNNDILKYLAFNEDPYIIIDYMNMIVSKDYTERMEGYDRAISFLSIITRHSKNDIVLNYILKTPKIRPKEVNIFVVFVSIINNLYSKPQLNKLEKHLEDMEQYDLTQIETSFVITIKNKVFYDEQPKFLLGHDMDCKRLIDNCILGYMEKLIMAIKVKIQSRLLEIDTVKTNFVNFRDQFYL